MRRPSRSIKGPCQFALLSFFDNAYLLTQLLTRNLTLNQIAVFIMPLTVQQTLRLHRPGDGQNLGATATWPDRRQRTRTLFMGRAIVFFLKSI
jgi:hypothetical protein